MQINISDNNILLLAHQRKQRRAHWRRYARLCVRATWRDPECRDLALAVVLIFIGFAALVFLCEAL